MTLSDGTETEIDILNTNRQQARIEKQVIEN